MRPTPIICPIDKRNQFYPIHMVSIRTLFEKVLKWCITGNLLHIFEFMYRRVWKSLLSTCIGACTRLL